MVTYDEVNQAWPKDLPTLTIPEALKRATSLRKRFMNSEVRRAKWGGYKRPRRSWASTEATRNSPRSGWRELVHDVSHEVFSYAHAKLKDHSHRHADLELRIIQYVVNKTDWLKPKSVSTPTRDEKVAAKRAQVEASLKQWRSKLTRAENAISKLERTLTALDKGVLPRGRKKPKKQLSLVEQSRLEESRAKREFNQLVARYGIEPEIIGGPEPSLVYPPPRLFERDEDDPYYGDHTCSCWTDALKIAQTYVKIIEARA